MPSQPTDLEVLFASLAPTGPEFSQKKMFGYLCCFVDGNLFAGVNRREIIFRLASEDQVVFLKLDGASTFTPRPDFHSKRYVSLPDPLAQDPRILRKWMSRALAHVSKMPRRTKAKKSSSSKTA